MWVHNKALYLLPAWLVTSPLYAGPTFKTTLKRDWISNRIGSLSVDKYFGVCTSEVKKKKKTCGSNFGFWFHLFQEVNITDNVCFLCSSPQETPVCRSAFVTISLINILHVLLLNSPKLAHCRERTKFMFICASSSTRQSFISHNIA